MRGHGARRVMCAASGSNQKLNSWRGAGGELGIGGLRVEAAAHDDDALSELGEVRIDRDGERDIGERASGKDGDLMRVGVHLADEEVGGVFVDRLGVGRALGHRRHEVGVVGVRRRDGRIGDDGGHHCSVSGRGEGGRALSPGAEPADFAVEGGLEARLLLVADEREDGAGHDRDIGAADHLEHAEGVLHFFIAPCVAGDHGDAEHVDVGRLQEDHHRHLVRAAGAGAVLIDENEALLRDGWLGGEGSEDEGGEDGFHGWVIFSYQSGVLRRFVTDPYLGRRLWR